MVSFSRGAPPAALQSGPRPAKLQTRHKHKYSRRPNRKIAGINPATGASILSPRRGIEPEVPGDDRTARFEQTFLPYLDAAHNLARWLSRNPQDAEDAVQESYLCALVAYASFRGQSPKAWLLAIVRNTCFSRLRRAAAAGEASEFDERVHSPAGAASDPESLAIEEADSRQVAAALEALPEEFREAIVLRELEELSYKEIAAITGVPIGTVMSRLARARERLRWELSPAGKKEAGR